VTGALRRRPRPTPDERRRRRQLVGLLTRLVLCSFVLALVYLVVRALDVVLVEFLTVAARPSVVSRLLGTEMLIGDTRARQVRRVKLLFLAFFLLHYWLLVTRDVIVYDGITTFDLDLVCTSRGRKSCRRPLTFDLVLHTQWSYAVAAILRGPGGQRAPHFPEWGSRIRL